MIVTLLVIVYLAFKTYRGWQTGFTKRITNLIFSAIIFIIAIFFQNPLGNWLYQQTTSKTIEPSLPLNTNLMLFHFLGFFIIFFVGKFISKSFKSWLPSRDPHEKNLSAILDGTLGAVVSFIASYFTVYIILSMINSLQNSWFIQQTLDSSFLRFIIYDTPILSNGIFNSLFSLSRTTG